MEVSLDTTVPSPGRFFIPPSPGHTPVGSPERPLPWHYPGAHNGAGSEGFPRTERFMARALMIQGTGSHVGKSVITAALCRIFREDGINVAPFKAQNMALNSFVTRDGKEMGRAQVVQAEAAGIEPHVDMNPILLKPHADKGSQVIIHGKVYGNFSAADYHRFKSNAKKFVEESYGRLASGHDLIVIEGRLPGRD